MAIRWLRFFPWLSRRPAPAEPLPRCLGARTIAHLSRPDGTQEVRTLLDLLLEDAVQANASDIHFNPFPEAVHVLFRIDGVLHDILRLPATIKGTLANVVKVMADLKVYEQRVPQEGKARAPVQLGGFEIRVSLSPMVSGEKISLRLFRTGERRFSPEKLGFSPETLAEFLRLIEKPYGLMLLAGPTGSGKTTALYTALTQLAETRGDRLNITTVEDPVECVLPRVNQASVNESQGYTYPVALRSLLRHDPQVIMIGEIRDEQTAAIALRAALSGHLVLSTVHSATAAEALSRLINLKLEPAQLASAVSGILNLRLVRFNCPHCAAPYQPAPEVLARLGGHSLEQAFFRKGTGCAECGFTGFRGRVPLTELMVINPELEQLIAQSAPSREIHEAALAQGMRPLSESARQRVFRGETTLEEVAGYLS